MKQILFIVLCIAAIGCSSVKTKTPAKQIVITPMNQDNEGRELYIMEVNGKVYDYMYAEEIGMSLLRDSVLTDEMIHFCDHEECKEGQ